MAGLRVGQGVLRRKPIETIEEAEETEAHGEHLTRTLGLWQLTAIGVGGIIGAGIFSLAGTIANGVAGPAVLVSFLIAGVASAAAAFSYAEFAGLIPRAGSAYTYGYAVLGEIGGWFIGWDLLLEYTAIVAVVAIGISGYINFLLGELDAELPKWMLGAPGTGAGHHFDLFAAVLCLLIAYLLTMGIKNAARFETIVVGLKILVVLLVVAIGFFHIKSSNYTPVLPVRHQRGVHRRRHGLLRRLRLRRHVDGGRGVQGRPAPHAEGDPLLAGHLDGAVRAGVPGAHRHAELQAHRPEERFLHGVQVGGAGRCRRRHRGGGAIIGIMTVMFTFMLGVTRVWFAMSRDGLLPKWFAHTHPTRHVPTRVTWIVGIASAAIAGLVPIGEAAELTNIGILLAFAVVCTAVIVLRYKRPDLPRSFRCPGVPVVPGIGVLASIWLITYLAWQTWVRFAVWFVIGLAVYFCYSYKHSELAHADARGIPRG
ncbi:amino acid permease [Streptomyces olivoverticillatus]